MGGSLKNAAGGTIVLVVYVLQYWGDGRELIDETVANDATPLPRRGDVIKLGPSALLYDIHDVKRQIGDDGQLSLVEVDVDIF